MRGRRNEGRLQRAAFLIEKLAANPAMSKAKPGKMVPGTNSLTF
ncbi:MAG: hypothetical protein ABSC76_11685 [Terracidiphilus sp.]